MKKVLTGSMSIILSFIFSSSNANAFHKVTEILPCGKLLICKDYNQVRNGNSVVEYKDGSSRFAVDGAELIAF